MKDAQENSLQSQQEYFTEYIQRHPDWVFAGMYTDDGISGLSIRRRDGFNRMVVDALDGKIDLIITKSLSRFARNTVDALTTIRSLKAAGVAVYFQKENINTMDNTGEFFCRRGEQIHLRKCYLGRPPSIRPRNLSSSRTAFGVSVQPGWRNSSR